MSKYAKIGEKMFHNIRIFIVATGRIVRQKVMASLALGGGNRGGKLSCSGRGGAWQQWHTRNKSHRRHRTMSRARSRHSSTHQAVRAVSEDSWIYRTQFLWRNHPRVRSKTTPHKQLTPERQGPGVMLYCLTCKALRPWLWITRFRAAKVRTFIEANKFLDAKILFLSIFAISQLIPCSLVSCEKRAYSDRPASLAYGSQRFAPIHIPIR